MVILSVVKSSNTPNLFIGASNRIIYSIVITNTGDTRATCVRVKDVLEANARIIPNTVKVDGCGNDVLLSDMSISIGVIEPGGNSIITYEVEVSKNCIRDTIANKAIVSYCDRECSNNCNKFTVESNLLIIPIIFVDVKISKSVDKTCAKVGDVLSYTIVIRNDSNVDIENAVLNDFVSADLIVFPATVLINGIPQYIDDLAGVLLGTIPSYTSVIVQFKGQIREMPSTCAIKNEATLSFEYTVLENGIEIVSEGLACSNDIFTRIIERNCCC